MGWIYRHARMFARSALVIGVALALIAGGAVAVWSQGAAPRGMRDMMRHMMRGRVPPPGVRPEALPAPDTPGARLLSLYCDQCHDLPSPRYRTTAEWPDVLERMLSRLRMMSGGMSGRGMGGMKTPSDGEAHALLDYLQRYAMVPATPALLAAGPAEGRKVFMAQCSRCHATPAPTMHPPERWPGIVARMQANMALMQLPQLSEQQQEVVVRFLRIASSGAAH